MPDNDPIEGLSQSAKAQIFDVVYKFLRHSLTFAGGALVAHGYFTASTEMTLTGAFASLAGIAASLLNVTAPGK